MIDRQKLRQRLKETAAQLKDLKRAQRDSAHQPPPLELLRILRQQKDIATKLCMIAAFNRGRVHMRTGAWAELALLRTQKAEVMGLLGEFPDVDLGPPEEPVEPKLRGVPGGPYDPVPTLREPYGVTFLEMLPKPKTGIFDRLLNWVFA